MPFVLRPSRNATLQLAYALLAAEDKRAKKAPKPEPEAEEPKKSAKKGRKP